MVNRSTIETLKEMSKNKTPESYLALICKEVPLIYIQLKEVSSGGY